MCALLVTDDEDDAEGGNGGNVSELNLLLLVLLTPIRVDKELLVVDVLYLSLSSKSYRERYEPVVPLVEEMPLVNDGR